jgi:drug/metabolite transporter (DMT)-like permease
MKLQERLKDAFILAIIAAIFGGSVPVAAKIALEVFQPFTLIFIRFFSAMLFMLPYIWKSGVLKGTKLKTFLPVALIGAINPILLFIALQYTQASVSPFIYAGIPAMTAFYFYITKAQRLTIVQTLGIILGYIGVSLVVLLPVIEKHLAFSAFSGNLLIVCSATGFAIYGIMTKRLQTKLRATPMILTFYLCAVTSAVSIPFATWELVHNGLSTPPLWQHISSGIYIGIVGTVLFYMTYQNALKRGSEVAASLFTYLQPVVTILLAVVFLGEQITIPFVIGGSIAVIGASLASKK